MLELLAIRSKHDLTKEPEAVSSKLPPRSTIHLMRPVMSASDQKLPLGVFHRVSPFGEFLPFDGCGPMTAMVRKPVNPTLNRARSSRNRMSREAALVHRSGGLPLMAITSHIGITIGQNRGISILEQPSMS